MSKESSRSNRSGGHSPAFANVEKAKDFRGTFKKMLRYIGIYKFAIFIGVIFALLSTLFTTIGPKVLGMATTELFSGLMAKVSGTGVINFGKIGWILLASLSLYLVSAFFAFAEGWILTSITQKICFRMRHDISEKINRLPMKYFESRTVGEVLSRITNDVDTFGQGLVQSISQVITSIATVLGIIVVMLTISPLMTLIAVIVVPVSAILMGAIIKFSQKHFKEQQKSLGIINGQVEEIFSGHNVVKAFNREASSIETFNNTNDVLYRSAWKAQFLSGLMYPTMMFVGNLGYVGVAISGSMLALRGIINIGDIQAFIQYVKNLTQPISMLAQVSGMLQSMAAAAERVFDFLNEEEEVPDTGADTDISDITGNVSFDHISFGYDADKPIIKDFTSHIKSGQTVALVGPTGAGKTTIVKLLMRFYDVDSGSIRIDDTDIRHFKRSDLRKLFGMVLQETWLFKGSVMENIRYGRPEATDEEVIAAAKAANADHFIQTLPGGYNMEINEEAGNISQGERQLLTIARAILANNKVMILDEATSSVDTRTEQHIQKAMELLTESRTSFIIAHRLSTIRNADLILVMKDGDIIEQGKHDELLAQKGFYAELYNSQFSD